MMMVMMVRSEKCLPYYSHTIELKLIIVDNLLRNNNNLLFFQALKLTNIAIFTNNNPAHALAS